MYARAIYDQTRLSPWQDFASVDEAVRDFEAKGWAAVGRWTHHRPGAKNKGFQATQWRGEQLARLFVTDVRVPGLCEVCDCQLSEHDADLVWRFSHVDCIAKIRALIMARGRDGGVGRPGAWGLSAIHVQPTERRMLPRDRRFCAVQRDGAWYVEDYWEQEIPQLVPVGKFGALALVAAKNGKPIPQWATGEEAALFSALSKLP